MSAGVAALTHQPPIRRSPRLRQPPGTGSPERGDSRWSSTSASAAAQRRRASSLMGGGRAYDVSAAVKVEYRPAAGGLTAGYQLGGNAVRINSEDACGGISPDCPHQLLEARTRVMHRWDCRELSRLVSSSITASSWALGMVFPGLGCGGRGGASVATRPEGVNVSGECRGMRMAFIFCGASPDPALY